MNGDLHCCSLFLFGEEFVVLSKAELPNARFHLSMELRCGMKLGTMMDSFTAVMFRTGMRDAMLWGAAVLKGLKKKLLTCSRLVHGLFFEACPEDIAYDPWWVQEAGHNDIEMTHRHKL